MASTIYTSRLTLRPLEQADAEVLLRIYQTDGVLRYFPPSTSPTLEKIQNSILRLQEHWDNHGYGRWGIIPSGENQIIGWAGLHFIPELNETEVGYLLDKPYWGRGIATEAARASIEFGFKDGQLNHIIALVAPENIPSRRVVEKCDLTYIETIHLWEMDLMKHIRMQKS